MKPRRPDCGNRSDGGFEGSSALPGVPRVELPARGNLDSWGIPSYDADEVSSADGRADSPRNLAPLQDAGTASCWADLPDGLLREVRAAPALRGTHAYTVQLCVRATHHAQCTSRLRVTCMQR